VLFVSGRLLDLAHRSPVVVALAAGCKRHHRRPNSAGGSRDPVNAPHDPGSACRGIVSEVTFPHETTASPEAAGAFAPVGKLASVSLDCTDPSALTTFYSSLLGMRQVFATPDGSIVALSDGTVAVTMMRAEDHAAPTWPEPGQLQQMHLDVSVGDLEHAVASALALGAREADHQPAPDR